MLSLVSFPYFVAAVSAVEDDLFADLAMLVKGMLLGIDILARE